jgi:nickel transport protein
MKRIQRPLSLCLILSAPMAQAHGIWLEVQHGDLAVVYGHGAESDAYDPAKITGMAQCDGAAACTPLTWTDRTSHVALAVPEGQAIITATMDNGFWSQDAAGEWHNVAKDALPGATEGGQYLKYTTYVLDHFEGAATPTGMTLEIVPLADPLEMQMGDSLPVQVLLNGQPAAAIEITGDYVNDSDGAPIITGPDGRADIPLRNQGLNVILASASEPHPDPAKADEIGHTATLAFMLHFHGEE